MESPALEHRLPLLLERLRPLAAVLRHRHRDAERLEHEPPGSIEMRDSAPDVPVRRSVVPLDLGAPQLRARHDPSHDDTST